MVEKFETKAPIVASRTINEDKSVLVAPNLQAIAKCDVDVHDVKKFRWCAINGLAVRSLGNRCVRADGRREFTAVNKCTLFGGLDKVPVVSELPTTCYTMQLFRSPCGLSVQRIWGVTWADRWGSLIGVVQLCNDVVAFHAH